MAEVPTQTLPEPEQTTPTSDETKGEPTPEKTTPETAELPVKEEIDYKKKFGESTAEALRIREENKRLAQEKAELEAKLAKASETSSEAEMVSKYPDWDMMTENEKFLLKKQEETEKKLSHILEEKEWSDNYSKSLAKFPELANYDDDFKGFCKQYPKIDTDTLAKSFLFDKKEPEKQRKGLEKPSGGAKTPAQEGWKSEDIARLRQTDEKKYLEMVKKGIIKGSDIK